MAENLAQSSHAIRILSRMEQFHSDEKYWDVQLRVDTKVFKCQRTFLAANSQYFDTMFSSSNFQESNTTVDQPITLHELDATAFEELLGFMYTGRIVVKDSNVFQLLFMNDFLQLCTSFVNEECQEYVKSRSRENKPMSNALDLLCFAHLKGENVLLDTLLPHICSHLYHYYSEDVQLLEISSEILNALLKFSKNFIVPLPGSADILLKIVHKWINHNREQRSQYRSILTEDIDFGRISSNFSRSLINGLENAVDEVVKLSKDVESLSELKTVAVGIDTKLTDGDAQFEETISFDVENVSEVRMGQRVYSSSCTISNLSWKICVRRVEGNDNLFISLICDGTDLSLVWKCYASATIIFKSQKEGKEDFVNIISRELYSSDMKPICGWGHSMFSNWRDVLDPENGFMKNDNSITVVAHVHADVPFLKMI